MDPDLNFSKIKQMGFKFILLETGDLRYSYNRIAISNPKYWIWCIKTLSWSMLLRPVRGPVKKWMEGINVLCWHCLKWGTLHRQQVYNQLQCCSLFNKRVWKMWLEKILGSIGPPFSHHEQWIWIAQVNKVASFWDCNLFTNGLGLYGPRLFTRILLDNILLRT